MPWPERSVVSLRQEFVLKVLAQEESMIALCRQFGISRKTGYKWLRRFEKRGVAGLADGSKKPHTSPLKTSMAMVEQVIRLRTQHPTWGPKKLTRILEREHGAGAPSRKTVERVLREAGLILRRRRRPGSPFAAAEAPSFVVEQPNDLWTVDFKGWWRTQDHRRCDPLTIRDAHSRYLLGVRTLWRTGQDAVRPVFEQLFRRHGLPRAIQSDNGPPFANALALRGLTALSAWWVSLGIELVRSRPGCPQDNGGHERMHLDLSGEVQPRPAETITAQQRRCDEWTAEFNHVRPHEAIGLRTPAELYRPSPRPYPPPAFSYPAHWQTAVADHKGAIKQRALTVHVVRAVAGLTLGLEPHGPFLFVWLRHLLLGHFLPERDRSVQAGTPLACPDCHPECHPQPVIQAAMETGPSPGAAESEAQVLW